MLEAGRRSVAAVIFLVLACISGPLAAQDTLTVAVGERVRVSTESGATHVGLLSAMTSGALEVQGEGASQRFSVAFVTRLDVSRGQKSHTLLGAGIGFAAGALVGVVHCSGDAGGFSDAGKCDLSDDVDLTLWVTFVIGAIGGLAGGIIAGNWIKTERWEKVPLERLRVSLAPQRDGRFALGFSVRF